MAWEYLSYDRPMSKAQVKYIQELLKSYKGHEEVEEVRSVLSEIWRHRRVSSAEAHDAINYLLTWIYKYEWDINPPRKCHVWGCEAWALRFIDTHRCVSHSSEEELLENRVAKVAWLKDHPDQPIP